MIPRLKLKLKQCPFCGGEATVSQGTGNNGTKYYFYIECLECGGSAGWDEKLESATEVWNRRHKDA